MASARETRPAPTTRIRRLTLATTVRLRSGRPAVLIVFDTLRPMFSSFCVSVRLLLGSTRR